ncbi:hypothetical protein DE146DRAFT_653339 [Phaeosphaeria sp. MPI-PUGE-AT-0046c]|nr:hypothetical protein DE146DRAFT_653339 [Phaeosphaeria sp. MPI-PUGE-AT-0046c]
MAFPLVSICHLVCSAYASNVERTSAHCCLPAQTNTLCNSQRASCTLPCIWSHDHQTRARTTDALQSCQQEHVRDLLCRAGPALTSKKTS